MTINIIDSYLAQDLLVYGALSQRLYQSGNYYLVSLYLHAIYINSALKGKKMQKYAKSSTFQLEFYLAISLHVTPARTLLISGLKSRVLKLTFLTTMVKIR